MFTTSTQFIEKAVVVDPYTVQIICTQPKANLLGVTLFIVPEHIWSKISPEDAGSSVREPAADHRRWPLPGRRVEAQRLRAPGRQQGLPLRVRRAGEDRRAHLRAVPERRHDGRGPQGRQPRRRLRVSARPVRVAREHARHRDRAVHLVQLAVPGLQLLRGQVARQPGALGPALPRRPRVRHRPPAHRGRRLPRLRHPRVHVHVARRLEGPRLHLAAARRGAA